MDGEEAPLARRYGLQRRWISRRFIGAIRGLKGLTRAKEPAFLREVSIAEVNVNSDASTARKSTGNRLSQQLPRPRLFFGQSR